MHGGTRVSSSIHLGIRVKSQLANPKAHGNVIRFKNSKLSTQITWPGGRPLLTVRNAESLTSNMIRAVFARRVLYEFPTAYGFDHTCQQETPTTREIEEIGLVEDEYKKPNATENFD